MDDPNQVVPVLMERNKKYWEYERIFQWNTGIMDDDGNVCQQKQLQAKLGQFVYDYSTIHRSNDFLEFPCWRTSRRRRLRKNAGRTRIED